MRAKILVLISVLFIVLFSVGVSARTCTIADSCEPNNTVLKLSSATNAHGEIWSQTNYDKYLCCDFTTADSHTCSVNNKILKLSGDTNAHAEIPTGTAYSTDVCFGDLDCESATGSCPENKEIIIRLSENTNAHIAGSSETDYNTLICCDIGFTYGNGILEGPEECDDGNTNDGDGCSSTGTIEYGWSCSGEPSVCYPNCTFISSSWSATEVIDGIPVELNVEGEGFCDGVSINFEVFENELIGRDPAQTNPSNVVFNGSSATATWVAEWIDDGFAQGNPEYVFKASLVIAPSIVRDNSGELIVLPDSEGLSEVLECINITSCSDYLTYDECISDASICDIAEGNVEANNPLIACGEEGVSCECSWVSDSCEPSYTSVTGGYIIGTCSYDESTDDDCTDGFLSYSWTKTWTWGTGNGWDTLNNAITNGPSSDSDDYKLDGGIYYSDPYGNFDACQEGNTLVECQASIQVGFFGAWNFIIAVIILIGVYSFLKRNKKDLKNI